MFKIKNREISICSEPFIIAEVSGNHNGDIKKAFQIIAAAKKYGADAVKFQTYTPDTMTIKSDKPDFKIDKGTWAGRNLYDLYCDAHTPFEWQSKLFEYARKIGILAFSTPFDESAVDLLDKLDVPAYKIASFEIVDLELIKYIATKQKPVLISSGMASLDEIGTAIELLRQADCNNILLFHCVSGYPTSLEDSHLSNIKKLKKTFNVEIGLSDHTLGTQASIAAITLGASAIEKHFTINRSDGGPDSTFSLEPLELQELKSSTRDIWKSLNSNVKNRPEVENTSKVFRRSIYFIKDALAGDVISLENVKVIRPGHGLNPKHLNEILGKTLKTNVSRGDRLTWELIA